MRFCVAVLGLMVALSTGCSEEVPPEPLDPSPSADEQAADEQAPTPAPAGPPEGCLLEWMGPEPAPRKGRSIDLFMRVTAENGRAVGGVTGRAELVEPAADAPPPSTRTVEATTEAVDSEGMWAVTFDGLPDGRWDLRVGCELQDGEAVEAWSRGWRIDNVAPPAPTGFRRVETDP